MSGDSARSQTVRRPRSDKPVGIPLVGKMVGAVVGLVFAGIGITVIAFLWGTPRNDFFAPPLLFRVFGTFIALAFVAVGCAVFYGAVSAAGPLARSVADNMEETPDREEPEAEAAADTYTCPHCGAPVADGSDVSPHGDAKCHYCSGWFNVHGK